MDTRSRGNTARAIAPRETRMRVMSPGGSASNPIAMNRNDDPQMPDTARKSAQSRDVNWSSLAAVVAVNSFRSGVEAAVTMASYRRE